MPLSTSRQIIRHALSVLFAIVTLANQLTSSLLGVLVLLLGIYFLAPLFLDVEFLTMRETLDWVLSLPTDTLVTTAGIIAAYAIAVGTWRQQKAFEIRLTSAWHVASFLHEAAGEAAELARFAEGLQELKAADARKLPAQEGKATLLFDRVTKMIGIRARLSEKSVAIHTLRGQHEGVMANSFAPDMALIAAERALDSLAHRMWFQFPYIAEDVEQFRETLQTIDDEPWQAYANAADRQVPHITAGANGLVAIAQGRLFPPTLWAVIRTYRRAKIFMADKPNP